MFIERMVSHTEITLTASLATTETMALSGRSGLNVVTPASLVSTEADVYVSYVDDDDAFVRCQDADYADITIPLTSERGIPLPPGVYGYNFVRLVTDGDDSTKTFLVGGMT